MQFTNKQIWLITYPVLFSLLMEHIIGMTDTAFLGRVGQVELGASALAGVYYLAIFMLGFGFSVGAQILMARRNGEGEYHRIGSVFVQGVLFLLGVAALMFFISRTYSPLVLRKLIESDDVFNATISYTNWRVFGFFFSFVAVMFRAFYVSITKTKILTVNSIVMVLTNVCLNYILIFGKFGFPALGIAGAAIASSISELVSVIFYVIYTRYKVDYKKYGVFEFRGIKVKTLSRILNVSVWTMFQSFISVSVWFLFFVAVEHLGERPLAITNIVRNISSLPFIFMSAFASTGSALISNLMGAGEYDRIPGLCKRIVLLAYLFVIPILLILAIVPSLVLRIYTDNPELIADTIPSLLVMASAYLISVPGFVLFFAVSGTGNTRSALLMELAAIAVYVSYVYYFVIHLRMDVAFCWTTEHVYGFMILILSFLYLKYGNWRNKKI